MMFEERWKLEGCSIGRIFHHLFPVDMLRVLWGFTLLEPSAFFMVYFFAVSVQVGSALEQTADVTELQVFTK